MSGEALPLSTAPLPSLPWPQKAHSGTLSGQYGRAWHIQSMVNTADEWIISDSLKIVLVLAMLSINAMMIANQRPMPASRRRNFGAVARQRLMWANCVNMTITVVWLTDMHGLSGFGWRFFLVVSTMIVTLCSLSGLYVCFVIAWTQHTSSQLTARLPRWITVSYITVAVLDIVCQITGVVLTMVYDEYHWSVFRHTGTSFMIVFTGATLAYYVVQLKRMLASFSAGNGVDLSSTSAQKHDKLQRNLTRILLCSVPVCVLGILSGIALITATQENGGQESYSALIRHNEENYSVTNDITISWSILIVQLFVLYYVWDRKATRCPCLESLLPSFLTRVQGFATLSPLSRHLTDPGDVDGKVPLGSKDPDSSGATPSGAGQGAAVTSNSSAVLPAVG